MKNEIKAKIEHLLQHHERAVDKRDEDRANAQAARKKFEASFQNAITTVVIPAAEQVKAEIEPKGWTCNIRPAPLSITIEIFRGSMTAAAVNNRPHVGFKPDGSSDIVHAYVASQRQAGSEGKGIEIRDLTEDKVQECMLILIERLVNEGPSHRDGLDLRR